MLFCTHTKHETHNDELKASLQEKCYVFSVCVDGKTQTPFYPTPIINRQNRVRNCTTNVMMVVYYDSICY